MNQANLIKKFVKDGKSKGSASNIFIEGNVLYSYGHHFPLLVRRNDGFLQNADRYSVTTSHHQSMCSRYANFLIPFSILSRLNLDYGTVKIIDQSRERWDLTGYRAFNPDTKKNRTISIHEYRDFSEDAKQYCHKITERRPASLIMADPNNGKCYLASMDNNRYFASELSMPVQSVREGFDLLKPWECIGKVEGTDYLRQGEWFFIKPVDGVKPLKSSIQKGMEKETYTKKIWGQLLHPEEKECQRIIPISFLHNRNRELAPHHYATEYGFEGLFAPLLVRGTVRHSNGDHRMLKLGNGKQWYRAIESSHVLSVGTAGRVD